VVNGEATNLARNFLWKSPSPPFINILNVRGYVCRWELGETR